MTPAPTFPGMTTPESAAVTRAAVWNQGFWSAGSTLTGGAFLTYFANDLGARGFLVAVILALPETAGALAVFTGPIIRLARNRKRVWLACSLLSRLVSLGIPLMAFPALRPAGISPLDVLIACLGVSQVLQAIAYVAYLSWLSDLVPETNWGRFFARRSIARIVVQLTVPLAAAMLRDRLKLTSSSEDALIAYVAIFGCGVLLQLGSMAPVMRLPEVAIRVATLPRRWRFERIRQMSGSLWLLLFHNWHLALANGLTQAAFFKYRIGPLGVSLTQYYLLDGGMLMAMIPVSLAAGRWGDRHGYKWMLFWSALAASLSMPFWFVATREHWWWLYGAHLAWSSFAAVNLAGYNLALKLSPRSDNTLELALFQQVAGLLAGVSGLAGGFWLDKLLAANTALSVGGITLGAFQILFLVSFVGRLTAPLWVLGVREPRIAED